MVTHVLDGLSLDGDGHTAYPPGACSPVHPEGCIRCLEAENVTLRARVENLQDEVRRVRDRLIHSEANYGEELKRARAFESENTTLAGLLSKKTLADLSALTQELLNDPIKEDQESSQ